MQETRQHILEILKEREQATVDDIVCDLRERRRVITAVTVRHHLSRLQQDGLITAPQLRHRSSPGRPQHIYVLAEKAQEHFPDNYQDLAAALLNQIETIIQPGDINVILEGVADHMAASAPHIIGSLEERLDAAVQFLNQKGYRANWESNEEGYVLYTRNCPYHQLSASNKSLCEMDMRFISAILHVVPRLRTRITNGDASCSYLIPH